MNRAAAAALLIGACSSAPAEPSGVGPWDVTKTQRKDATGHCEPTDLPDGRKGTWCYMQPPLDLGGQGAQVDLYFGGTAEDAPLIELQLKFPACDFEKADAWARTGFGKPTTAPGGRAYFENRYLYVALVPAAGSRCLVRIFPKSEAKEFARIKSESQTPPPTP